jgi:hypothetical protein
MLDMNPGIRARWTAALRSGKYPQGIGGLRTSKGFCCLGVLCDLAVQDKVIEAEQHWGDDWSYQNETNYPPVEVVAWAGLDSFNPTVTAELGPEGLASVNDSGGYDFAKIADLIDGGAA